MDLRDQSAKRPEPERDSRRHADSRGGPNHYTSVPSHEIVPPGCESLPILHLSLESAKWFSI